MCNDFLIKVSSFFVLIIIFPTFLSGIEFKHSQPSRFSYDDIKASKQSDKFSIRKPSQNSQEDPRPGHRNQTNKVNSTINLGDKYSTHETQVSRRPSRKLETFRGQTDPRQSSIRIEKNTVETEENSDMSGSNPGYSTPINSNLNSASGECTHNSRIFSKSCSCKK